MEFNYAGMAFKANLDKDPDLMALDVATFEKHQAARRIEEAKANPIKPEPARLELNRLRGHLFTLQQNAKSYEQRVNDASGNVHEFEKRLTVMLKSQKEYDYAGNLVAARSYEHQIQVLEIELADARDSLAENLRWSSGAARVLRTWQTENGPRLKELEHEIKKLA